MKLTLVGVFVAQVAFADKPILVALAPAPDARQAIAIGPNGQAYEPDGKGSWKRTHGGGIANDVVSATRAGTTVIVGAAGAPPFKLEAGVWTVISLGQHAKAILGSGPRATAAIGRSIFALDRTPPTKLAEAPSPVLALAAAASTLVIETDRGLFRLEGGWKPIAGAPVSVVRLISDRFALVESGVLDLRSGKTIAWPSDTHVVAATALDDQVFAVSAQGTSVELVTMHAGKLDREPVALPPEIVGLVADHDGHVVIATRDGHLAVRDQRVWITTTVTDALPAPHPGPPPAVSR